MRWIVEVTASGSSPGTHKTIKFKKKQIVCMFQIEACAPFQKKDLIHPLQIIIITCTASISLVCFEIYYSNELKGHCLISCSSQSWGHGRNAVRNAAIKCPAVSTNCWTVLRKDRTFTCNAVFTMNSAALSSRGLRNGVIFCENCVSFWPQCRKFEEEKSDIMSKSSWVGCYLTVSVC